MAVGLKPKQRSWPKFSDTIFLHVAIEADAWTRSSCGGVLPHSQPQDRIPAGTDSRRPLDLSQRQRGTGADPCTSCCARSVRRGGRSWADGGSLLRAIPASETKLAEIRWGRDGGEGT